MDCDFHDSFIHTFVSIVFNLGEYRRNVTSAYRNHDFFRPDNDAAMTIRTNCAKHALEDVVQWLEMGGGEVAVSLKNFLENALIV